MISERGVAKLHGMDGSAGGDWARTLADSDVTQHSFWLFDTEATARSAEATFTTVRNLPDAPAVFVRVDVHRASRKRGT